MTSHADQPYKTSLDVDKLSVGYGDKLVVDRQSVSFRAGELTAIIGPNGCGKSTLLKAMATIVGTRDGQVRLGEREVASLARTERARQISYLPQDPLVPEAITVRELASRGRHPHTGLFRPFGAEDLAAVDAALDAVGITDLAEDPVIELSGGQRQRAWIALVLAQQAPVMLLDEPTTYLDLAHAVEVLRVAQRAAREGNTVIAVLHDLTLAARIADRIVVMADGSVRATGTPAEVIRTEVLAEFFGLDAEVVEVGGRPAVVAG